MAPDHFRKHWGFAVLAAAPLTLMTAVPALAQGLNTATLVSVAPLAIAVGAGGFGLVAMALMRKARLDARGARRRAAEQVASLRAMVDQYEALLSGSREVTILFDENGAGPARVLGQTSSVLPIGRAGESLLNFPSWLNREDAQQLGQMLQDLQVHGHAFSTSLTTVDGRTVRASGWVMGGGAAVRLRPAFSQGEQTTKLSPAASVESATVRAMISALGKPAFVRDLSDRLVFANRAYLELAKTLGKSGSETAPPELLDTAQLHQHRLDCANGEVSTPTKLSWPGQAQFELVEFPIAGGRAGFLRALAPATTTASEPSLAHIGGIIGALTTPIAIFNENRELVQYNNAYAQLWNLSADFLVLGLDERAILDKLRTEGMLPSQVNYQTWRAEHLESYNRKTPYENEPWHLPDGRSVKVFSAPAGPKGGVIYVFEDMTERLKLESSNRVFSNVQRETINALSEAVAVFGTNGRLTLCNPKFEELWLIDIKKLGERPHIDQIGDASAQALPVDGDTTWRDLKRAIIDLDPSRPDQTGRITRSDGRLLDFTITRLPDGQKMMTFLDVTESAGYSRVLKERNDALVAADVLKDAFVENVSYELRSPLTNILGFAQVLAEEKDTLTERQASYIDFILASSATLGVLIDNILDLASVDAGIAELNPEVLDIPTLIESAKAGLSGSFPDIDGKAQINLSIEIEDNLPTFIADGTRLVQVLYNLLSNAARFSPPGGQIHLSVSHRADRMLFTIEDEGPGLTDDMKAAIHPRIDSPSGRQRGAGLALTIVRTFVNLHGGTITAEKREPRGSRITVNLPRDIAMAGVGE
jgi:signal transduction histidine kinase